MVRQLAHFDPQRSQQVKRWPLREACLCYVQLMKDAALEDFRHRQLVYAIAAPYADKKTAEPPKVPEILKSQSTNRLIISADV